MRTWLVAYGIGAPVFVLGNTAAWKSIVDSGNAHCIATLFLVGVGLQVILAVLNKAVMWVCYYGELEVSYKPNRLYKACEWLSQQFWIDLLFDVGSSILFTIATVLVVSVIAPTS